MIISHQLKAIFIHNPKVAGTTIRKMLLPHTEHNKYLYQGFTPAGDLQDIAHLRVDQWDGELIESRFDNRYYAFGVVRDPVTRFQSAVSEFLRQHGDWFAKFDMPIEKFLLLMLSPSSIKHDWRFIHFCPQYLFFTDDPYSGVSAYVDDIFKFEAMGEWFEPLQNRLGINPQPLINRRPSEVQHIEMTPALMELISRLYQEDYIFFFNFYRNPSETVALDLSTHSSRIEHIHRNRPDVKARWPFLTFADKTRSEWDRIAAFEQTTTYLTNDYPSEESRNV